MSKRAILFGFVTAVLGWAPGAALAEQVASEQDRVVFLFTSDLRGRLADVGCQDLGSVEGGSPFVARVGAAAQLERRRAAEAGEPAPLVVDAGDALFPSPLVGDLAADPERARSLVRALQSAGYDGLAAGNTTMSAPRPALSGLLEAARDLGLPILVSNLSCDDEADSEACQGSVASLVAPHAIIERGPLRIGLLSLLPEDLGDRMSRQNLEGASFTAIEAAARDTVRQLRQDGADLVVLLSHVDRSETAPRRTLELMSQLPAEEAPDFVIAASTAGLAVRIRTAEQGAPILAVSGETIGRAVIVRGSGPDARWQVEEATAEPPPEAGDEVLSRILRSWAVPFCSDLSQPLQGGTLTEAMDQEDLLHLALAVMREHTRSELAFVNTGVIAGRRMFPIEGQLTEAHLRRAMPFDNELRVAMIPGDRLARLAQALVDSDLCTVAGLEKRGSTFYINGRALDQDGRYRVVTVDFVAEGGDGIIEDPSAWEFEEVPPESGPGEVSTLAQRMAHYLDHERGSGPLDPNARLDLYLRPLWSGSFRLELSMSDTMVTDRVGYDQPQLRRQGLFDMRFGAEVRGAMSTRDHHWDNLLALRYGRQRLESDVGTREFEWGESSDLINLRSAYSLDYIRNHLLSGAWYGPSAFVEYNLESEFDHQGDGNHFLEMTGTAGLQLKPVSWFLLQAGGGVRSEVLSDEPGPLPGVTVRGEITRRRFFGIPQAPIYLAALIDYFVSWPSEGPAHKLIAEGRIEIELLGPLRLTGTLRLFLYDEAGTELSTAVDSTLGLTVAMSRRVQTY